MLKLNFRLILLDKTSIPLILAQKNNHSIIKKRFADPIGFSLVIILIFLPFLTGCKSSKKATRNDDVAVEAPVRPKKKDKTKGKENHSIGDRIAKEALTWQGTPYKYGAQSKGVATDCSGLVVVVYEEIAKIKLPRNSAQQADFCNNLKEKEVRAGDLIFFATGKDKNKVSHVGIMIDGIRFVHASGSKGVIISDMETPYYIRTFKKYGRVPGM